MNEIKNNFTASDWDQIFPTSGESFKNGSVKTDISKAVKVLTAVFLPQRWDGMFGFETEDYNEEVLFRAGRWCVREGGIDCDETSYSLTPEQLRQDDSVAQLSAKTWLYDPSDMLDAFEKAYTIFFHRESEEERKNRINRQIEKAIERIQFPFNTSNILKSHVYLPTRMHEGQRSAFGKFLSDNGYYPTF
jgi:hypothetical protein